MHNSDEIPKGVPADPSLRIVEQLSSYLSEGGGMSFLRLRERDGAPVLVRCSAGAPPEPLVPGPIADCLAFQVLSILAKNRMTPAADEAAIELEDEDGQRLGYAIVQGGSAAREYYDARVSLYDQSSVKVATFCVENWDDLEKNGSVEV